MSGIDRRQFLKGTAAASAGLLPFARAAGGAEEPRVRRTVTLGRTGLRISDIGFGSSRLSGDEALVRHALDRGITYFDTAEGYTGGESEKTIGRALEGLRDRVTLASKTNVEVGDDRDAMMRALEGSLRRLRTDHVDVYFMHAVNDVARIANPEWPEFVSRAKQQGKIRWSGMSGHGGNLVECVDHAVEHDLVDVLLLAYNFGQDPGFMQRFTASMDFVAVQEGLPRAMEKARAKGVGIVAMKTLRGAKLNDMRPHETEGGTFAQAAFRWVLSGPYADALVVTMKSPSMVDEYLGASGATGVSRHDVGLLARYEGAEGRVQCRYGCDACASACPEGVAIPEVLRARMYAEDYEDAVLAREEYRRLGADASPCVGCAHQSCLGACPAGIPIASLTSRTHRRLASRSGRETS